MVAHGAGLAASATSGWANGSGDVRLLNSPHPQPHEQQDFQAAAPPGGMHQNCTHYFGTCVCTNLRPVQHAGNASCSALFSPLAAADLQDVTTASKALRMHATALSVFFSCRYTLPVGAPNTPPTGRALPVPVFRYIPGSSTDLSAESSNKVRTATLATARDTSGILKNPNSNTYTEQQTNPSSRSRETAADRNVSNHSKTSSRKDISFPGGLCTRTCQSSGCNSDAFRQGAQLLGSLAVREAVDGGSSSHDGNPRIVVTTTSDPIVRSFSGGSEEDFPPSKVNRRRRRKWEYEPIRRSTLPGQCSQADGSTERRVQTRSIAPLVETLPATLENLTGGDLTLEDPDTEALELLEEQTRKDTLNLCCVTTGREVREESTTDLGRPDGPIQVSKLKHGSAKTSQCYVPKVMEHRGRVGGSRVFSVSRWENFFDIACCSGVI
ncbi:hypothetical protein Bbelb_314880 [Branchiostoma belcheri]|nr:hypothetical protein Bbelb_314880 [Branchiostoma belcheri]